MSLHAVTSPDVPAPLSPAESRRTEVAHALRLLRLLITAVDHAENGALILKADSALVALVRRLMTVDEGELYTTRTAVMALRDLVWRVDTVRDLLETLPGDFDRGLLASLLDTHDIHVFLGQEP